MIRRATREDIPAIAAINRFSFSGNKPPGVAEQWIMCHFNQAEQYHYFVFEKQGHIFAYIGWEIKGGFARAVPVLELEQLAVHPDHRGQGIGKKLTEGSFVEMKRWVKALRPEAARLRIFVWTKKTNSQAQSVYAGVCNRSGEYSREIYGAEETMMSGEHEL